MEERFQFRFDIGIFIHYRKLNSSAFDGAAHFTLDLMPLFLINAGEIIVKTAVQGNARGGTIDLFVIIPAAFLGFRFEGGEGERVIGEVIPIEGGPVPGSGRSEEVDESREEAG